LKGIEMPIPRTILVAPNLEEVLLRSNYYQKLLFEKVALDPKAVYGKSISTYPSNPSTNLICDTYLAKIYDNFAIMVIADGCNWGIYSAMAAQFATLGFVRHVEVQPCSFLASFLNTVKLTILVIGKYFQSVKKKFSSCGFVPFINNSFANH